jgi:hypothetical protein
MSTSAPTVDTDEVAKKEVIDHLKALAEGIAEFRTVLRSMREKTAQLENDGSFKGPARLTSECDRLIQASGAY